MLRSACAVCIGLSDVTYSSFQLLLSSTATLRKSKLTIAFSHSHSFAQTCTSWQEMRPTTPKLVHTAARTRHTASPRFKCPTHKASNRGKCLCKCGQPVHTLHTAGHDSTCKLGDLIDHAFSLRRWLMHCSLSFPSLLRLVVVDVAFITS